MKIKMLTTSAGPDPSKNWHEGQIMDVPPEDALPLVSAGIAVIHGRNIAVVSPPETEEQQPEETAVVAQPKIRTNGGKK